MTILEGAEAPSLVQIGMVVKGRYFFDQSSRVLEGEGEFVGDLVGICRAGGSYTGTNKSGTIRYRPARIEKRFFRAKVCTNEIF